MKVGDLVTNTYIGSRMQGKVGLVVGFSQLGDVVVRYGNQTHRFISDCLEVVSASR